MSGPYCCHNKMWDKHLELYNAKSMWFLHHLLVDYNMFSWHNSNKNQAALTYWLTDMIILNNVFYWVPYLAIYKSRLLTVSWVMFSLVDNKFLSKPNYSMTNATSRWQLQDSFWTLDSIIWLSVNHLHEFLFWSIPILSPTTFVPNSRMWWNK